jgi:DNA-directed RNA polymerase sigma subunit (sigma70/sigma32)
MERNNMRTCDELAEEAIQLIPLAASKFKCPKGLNAEDLESAGNEALLDAAIRFDESAGVPWKNFAYQRIKWAMQKAVRKHRQTVASSLQPEIDGETMSLPVDPKSSSPLAIAEARELVTRRQPKLSIRSMEQSLPDPAAVADQVTKLRAAMFGAISADDVADVMQSVVSKAKGGDLKASKLVMDLLAPGRSGSTVVHQQAVIVSQQDIT